MGRPDALTRLGAKQDRLADPDLLSCGASAEPPVQAFRLEIYRPWLSYIRHRFVSYSSNAGFVSRPYVNLARLGKIPHRMAERKPRPEGLPARIRAAVYYGPLDQAALATRLGVSTSKLARWMAGDWMNGIGKAPSDDDLAALSRATGFPLPMLQRGFDDGKPVADRERRLRALERAVSSMEEELARMTSDRDLQAQQIEEIYEILGKRHGAGASQPLEQAQIPENGSSLKPEEDQPTP